MAKVSGVLEWKFELDSDHVLVPEVLKEVVAPVVRDEPLEGGEGPGLAEAVPGLLFVEDLQVLHTVLVI